MQGTTIITVIFKRLQREQSGGSGKNSGGPRGRAKAEGGGQKASNRVLSGESGQSTTPPPPPHNLFSCYMYASFLVQTPAEAVQQRERK